MSFSEREHGRKKEKSPSALAKECLLADMSSDPPIKGSRYLLETLPEFLIRNYSTQPEAACLLTGAGYAIVELAMSDDHALKKREDLNDLVTRLKNGQIVAQQVSMAVSRLDRPELSSQVENMNVLASHFGVVRSALEELARGR